MTLRNFLPSRAANCCTRWVFLNHYTVLNHLSSTSQSLEPASTHFCKDLRDEKVTVVTTAVAGCKCFIPVSPFWKICDCQQQKAVNTCPCSLSWILNKSTTCHRFLALEKQIVVDCSGLKSLRFFCSPQMVYNLQLQNIAPIKAQQ